MNKQQLNSPIIVFLMLCTFGFAFVSSAQQSDTCQAIVAKALEIAGNSCRNLEPNQACYGYNQLNVVYKRPPDATSIEFSALGEVLNLEEIDYLEADSIDVENETWGVTILNIQPDTSEATATMLLLGEAIIEDRAATYGEFAVDIAVQVVTSERTWIYEILILHQNLLLRLLRLVRL